ncbi:MAG TPA: YraN family protein [Deltaproteobacteria bacterium]|nr:YraN family protein [Deltaproteobacteria bacterium]
MPNLNQLFGKRSETDAVTHLKKQGYEILETNYRNRLGEIDIIAKDRDTIAFVEVKARKSKTYGNPKWAVTQKKQRKISMVALSYLKSTRQIHAKARFDVVTVTMNFENTTSTIDVIKNAFELAYG